MTQPTPLPLATVSSCGSAPGSVPVFNCVIILRTDRDTGRVFGRVANLPDISADGFTERDVLLVLTRRFKATVQEHLDSEQVVPWIEPPVRPGPGETERFVPVHL